MRNLHQIVHVCIVHVCVVHMFIHSFIHWAFGMVLYGMPAIMENALQFIWFWPNSCVNPILRGATSSHLNSLGSIQWCCLTQCTLLFKPFAIIINLPYTGRVRNPVVEHESDSPQVVFNVHHYHRHDSTHPSLFTELGTTHIYMECITAGYSHVSHTLEQCI